jgi:protocatechuate 3,4-dioxygenase alpha subunit
MKLVATCAQTVGPFFSIGLSSLITPDIAGLAVEGQRLTIQGRVLDGVGQGIDDAVLEIWQANRHGRYHHPTDTQDKPLQENFHGFGRVMTNHEGAFWFATIKPGPVPGPHGTVQAPHLVVAVGMRGLLKHLLTRIYFPDELGNAQDPILQLVDPSRRASLIARNTAQEARAPSDVLEWNLICQGENETVFFDY